jgi:hypothetical protein
LGKAGYITINQKLRMFNAVTAVPFSVHIKRVNVKTAAKLILPSATREALFEKTAPLDPP